MRPQAATIAARPTHPAADRRCDLGSLCALPELRIQLISIALLIGLTLQ
jgi:hypothetical protein